MIDVCIPVLKRYDLLRTLLISLSKSDLRPDIVRVIDNGQNRARLVEAFAGLSFRTDIFIPNVPMGLAASWNWFIANSTGERLITNDDIIFAPGSLGEMYAARAPFVSCGHGFSCFLLRDECVNRVGYFDEEISPGYAYFEDMDYLRRMQILDVQDEVVECGVVHAHSQTPAAYTPQEWEAHHKRFLLARSNYERKWGTPSWDQLKRIGGAGANA